MDMNNQNSSGMMNGLPPQSKTDKKIGPIVGALIIVLIIIIASLYIFGKNLNTETEVMTPEAATTEETSDATASVASPIIDDTTSLDAELDAQLKDVDYSF